MAGYWVVRSTAIKDQSAADEYAALWGPIANRYGAEVIAGKGQIETREGQTFPRQLIIRFSSFENAINCYEDADYARAMTVAGRAFDRELSILEG